MVQEAKPIRRWLEGNKVPFLEKKITVWGCVKRKYFKQAKAAIEILVNNYNTNGESQIESDKIKALYNAMSMEKKQVAVKYLTRILYGEIKS